MPGWQLSLVCNSLISQLLMKIVILFLSSVCFHLCLGKDGTAIPLLFLRQTFEEFIKLEKERFLKEAFLFTLKSILFYCVL